MKTKIIKIDSKHPNYNKIEEAVRVIKNGGLVVYPTETCYGLGGDATNLKVIERTYRIKKRPKNKPIPILVSSLDMMKNYGVITKKTKKLVNKFMPGPLTLVVRKKKLIPDVLSKRGIAFRISSHPVANGLVKAVGSPITTTSANMSGQPPIYEINKINEIFKGKVEMILDSGNLTEVQPSTYVDMRSDEIKILREGPVPKESICKELKN